MSVDIGKITKAMQYLQTHTIEIGILGINDKDVPGLSGGSEKEYTVLEYGWKHEFGSEDGKTPARAYFRNAINSNEDAIVRYVEDLINQILEGKLDGRPALKKLGLYLQGLVIQSIASAGQWATPLKDSTLRRKTKTHPNRSGQILIQDGFLIKSIRFAIKKNGNIVELSPWGKLGG